MKRGRAKDLRDLAVFAALTVGGDALRRSLAKLGGGVSRADSPKAGLDLTSALKHSGDAITSATLEGVITGWNLGAQRLYGYSFGEAVGRTVWEITRPLGGADVVTREISKVKRGETVGPFDAVHHTRDGRPLNVSVALSPVRGPEGEVVNVLAVSRNVTGRVEAEETSRRSEARFVEAQSVAQLGSWEWNVRTGEQYWSDEVYRILGYEPGAFVAAFEKLVEVVHPDDRGRVRQVADDVLRQNRPFALEHRVVRPDGEVRTVHCRADVVLDEEGEPLRMIGTVHNVTGRKKIEEELRESEERYRAVVEHSMDGIYLFDGETGRILETNPSLREMLGYTADELSGIEIYDLIAHSREHVDCDVRRTLEEGQRFVGERRYRKKNGAVVGVEVSASTISYNGRPVICALARDATERKRGEEALHASETRFRTVIEQSPLSIHIFTPNGRSLRSNEAWNELWHLGEGEEPEGTNIFEDEQIRAAGLVPYVEESVAQLRSVSTPPLYYDPSQTGREGDARWLQASVYPVEDEAGQIVEMALIIEDISERKQAEDALKESEERYREVLKQSVESIYLFDPETKRVLEANAAFQQLLGYTSKEILETRIYDFIAADHEDIDENVRRDLREGQRVGERTYRRKNGSLVDVEVSMSAIPYGSKDVLCVVARDVTERKEAEKALRESEERFRTAFEDAPVGVALVGLDRRFLRVNRALCEMLGYSEEELLKKTSMEITHPDDLEKSMERTRQVLEAEAGSSHLEKRYIHSDGRVVWVLSSVSLVQDSEGSPDHFVALFQDVTERRALEERLEHQAFHDPLTDLPNRALFTDRLGHALARLNRRKEPIAVLFVDLDNFKHVNDSLGHGAGDRLLVAAAKRLRNAVRPEDTVARLGGDEFTVLLEGVVDRGGAARAAERISRSMQIPFHLGGREIFTGVSIGIALTDTTPEETEDLLKNADLALYSAKRKGRNRYEFFEEELDAQLRERLQLEGDLRRAIEREELRIFYQPKISMSTGLIVSLEALVRWEHPERGLLEPNEFLPVAEESNLIVQIGEWALDEVCRQGRAWQERYPEESTPRVCANVSPRQFLHTDLVDRVAKALRESGLEAGRLSLEVDEGILMEDAEANVEKLTALNDLGIHIVIDDFGTAYSSLAQLKNFPLNILKIDRSLVIRLGEEPEDKAIVKAMIQLAQALGWAVTAQGVENEEQLAMLRELGCDIVQGYYFTRPVTVEEATVLLEEFSQRSALGELAAGPPREV